MTYRVAHNCIVQDNFIDDAMSTVSISPTPPSGPRSHTAGRRNRDRFIKMVVRDYKWRLSAWAAYIVRWVDQKASFYLLTPWRTSMRLGAKVSWPSSRHCV